MEACQHCTLAKDVHSIAGETTTTRIAVERLAVCYENLNEKFKKLDEGINGNGKPGCREQHAAKISEFDNWRSSVRGALVVIGIAWTASIAILVGYLTAMWSRLPAATSPK